MNTRIRRIISVCGIIIFIVGATTLAIGIQFVASANTSSPPGPTAQEHLDMLIFVSPQYANDLEIEDSINSYIKAVKKDLNWNTRIITITQEMNNYLAIDNIIEEYYSLHPLKACIFVGEDTNTPLAGDSNNLEKPSTVPWFTIKGTSAYEMSEQGIVCQQYTMDICISLLYPTSSLDYEIKKSQILTAFDKFTTRRVSTFSNKIAVFESSDINMFSKELYQTIALNENLEYFEDPTSIEISNSLIDSYLMYFVHGHSNPSGSVINANEKVWFSANNIDELNTPLFGADGCYVGGWWSDQTDNNILDPSNERSWYGSKIFTGQYIQVMVLGMLSQNGYSSSVSFIENVVPELLDEKTLAEAMIGDFTFGDTIIVGDPTFHFTV